MLTNIYCASSALLFLSAYERNLSIFAFVNAVSLVEKNAENIIKTITPTIASASVH